MGKYKNINKLLLGVFLVCLSSVSHGAGMPPYEEEVLKLADLTVPVSTRAEIAQNILSNGAPEHCQEASAACTGPTHEEFS